MILPVFFVFFVQFFGLFVVDVRSCFTTDRNRTRTPTGAS